MMPQRGVSILKIIEVVDVMLAEKLPVCQSKSTHVIWIVHGAKLSFLCPAHCQ